MLFIFNYTLIFCKKKTIYNIIFILILTSKKVFSNKQTFLKIFKIKNFNKNAINFYIKAINFTSLNTHKLYIKKNIVVNIKLTFILYKRLVNMQDFIRI